MFLIRPFIKLKAWFKHKTKEHTTIMVLPLHSSSTYSFQLTWGLIFFLVAIFLSMVTLSGIIVYQEYQLAYEKQQLAERYGKKLNLALDLRENNISNHKRYEKLLAKLKTLASIANITTRELAKLKPESSHNLIVDAVRSINQNTGPREHIGQIKNIDLLRIVSKLRNFRSDLIAQQPLIDRLQFLLVNTYQAYRHIPIRRPFSKYTVKNVKLKDSSNFGYRIDPFDKNNIVFHSGFDIAGPIGTPVVATASGIVRKSSYEKEGYGKIVVIKHKYDYSSAYAHLHQIFVNKGDKVKSGQVIGSIGNSGRSTGAHLHYEVQVKNGKRLPRIEKIDPLPYICALDIYSKNCKKFHY